MAALRRDVVLLVTLTLASACVGAVDGTGGLDAGTTDASALGDARIDATSALDARATDTGTIFDASTDAASVADTGADDAQFVDGGGADAGSVDAGASADGYVPPMDVGTTPGDSGGDAQPHDAAASVDASAPMPDGGADAGPPFDPLAGCGAPTVVASFESASDLSAITANQTGGFARVSRGASDGAEALELVARISSPLLTIPLSTTRDLRGGNQLAVDVTNPGTTTVRVTIGVINAARVTLLLSALVPPGAGTLFLDFEPDPVPSYGMRVPPRCVRGARAWSSATSTYDRSAIVSIQLGLNGVATGTTVDFDDVRSIAAYDTRGLVDGYGQWSRVGFAGRIASTADIAALESAEQADLAANPSAIPLATIDAYGGLLAGPSTTAAGYFRTLQVGTQWWLVTPAGHAFFSSGMNTVTPHTGPTIVSIDPASGDSAALTALFARRAAMFPALPPMSGDPLSGAWGTASSAIRGIVTSGHTMHTFDFVAANLIRRYDAATYANRFTAGMPARLRSWGFNTVSIDSTQAFASGAGLASRVPYAVKLLSDSPTHVGTSGIWGAMVDPFDAGFVSATTTAFRSRATSLGVSPTDPWLVGYFVDNELSWHSSSSIGSADDRYDLAVAVLASDAASSPAKAAFMTQLQTTYGSGSAGPGAFSTAWALPTRYSSWSTVAAGITVTSPSTLSSAATRDMQVFTRGFAARYFTGVRSALDAVDPNHLYLGCRFASFTPEVVDAAQDSVDVLSYNRYWTAISADLTTWGMSAAPRRPILVSEYHFGTLDRGMFGPGNQYTDTSAERAAAFQGYVGSALDVPFVVGAHWYRLFDEALTGRPTDGENYIIGFLSVTDAPYPELVSAARALHSSMYARHAASR